MKWFKYVFYVLLLVVSTSVCGQSLHFSNDSEITTETSTLGQQIPILLKVDSTFDINTLNDLGIRIGSRILDVISLRITAYQIEQIEQLPGVNYIHLAQQIRPLLNKATVDIRADSVHEGFGLEQKYTGKGVLIGITDWGFDYTHPMFYDSAMQHTRILAAWDQFKTAGPAPQSFDYGTEYIGESQLLSAQSDTANIYGYGTHGTHVAGIAGGSGAGTEYRGIAYNANFVLVTFLVDEAAVLDAFSWMKSKADSLNMRLVVNMSWGLTYFGTLDGNSLLSQAIDAYTALGVVFVTSGGNNGDVNAHILKTFNNDTLQTLINFYPYGAHPHMWGQSISMWGEQNEEFGMAFTVYNEDKKLVYQSQLYHSANSKSWVDSFCIIDSDTIFYNITIDASHPLNGKPHIRFRIKNTNTKLNIGLKTFANSGTVHHWNIVELNNGVGNWGLPFTSFLPGWESGDNKSMIAEPACTKSAITVGAHSSVIKAPNGTVINGSIASFSSQGPTADGRIKPDITAPGVNVLSSISSFTDNSFAQAQEVIFKGKQYPFARFSGTSMSSPATTGTVALMLEANPSMDPLEVKKVLQQTARTDDKTGDLPAEGSNTWGRGKVNAYAAVIEAEKLRPIVPVEPLLPTFTLYPNPCSSVLFYDGDFQSDYAFSLYSVNGQLLKSGTTNNLIPIDISFLSNGLFFVKVCGADCKTFRVVKSH